MTLSTESREDNYSLPPDLYSRNFLISRGIEEYKKKSGLKSVRVLDIGGRNGQMDKFLDSQDELLLLDIRKGGEKNLIIGDATDMAGFKDGSFDVVISGDVYEHIPKEKRVAFINESMRVAKGLVIHAAPFAVGDTAEYEKLANDYFKKLHGIDHEWLKEHIDNGLPKSDDLEELIKRKGYEYRIIKSNNLDSWILMQYAIAYAYHFSLDPTEIYEFYNKNMLTIEDESKPFYRQVFFISKNECFPKIQYLYRPETRNELIELIFIFMAKTLRNEIISKQSNCNPIVRQMAMNFYRKKMKKFVPRAAFELLHSIKSRKNNRFSQNKEKNKIKKFPESKLAHKYLDGLAGLEIGGSAHNDFGLQTRNVDFTDAHTIFKQYEVDLCGKSMAVDIIAPGDNIPVPDESEDFIISSHVIEHFPDPIKALKEWYRIIKPGGYIFMIVPHKERTFDKDKNRTTLQELIKRHDEGFCPEVDTHTHYSVWITQDVVELVAHLGWKVVAVQDTDDKVGNGFTIVIQK
jgi:ubiquinone/menaquinone biosynthesis C-methylase UbiE